MRLRKKPWITEAVKEYEDILFTGDLSVYKDGWDKAFGREAPLHVEVGTGKGRFVAEMAEAYPEYNFIGIEAQVDVLYYAAQKAREKNLPNLKLLLFDVNNILDIFENGEISRLYINFCDPWPKLRHAKRRLTHTNFLDKYRLLLSKEGEIFFKTDNEALFEFSLGEFIKNKLLVKNISFDLHNSDIENNIMTEYEEKFSQMGMKIYRCEISFP